MSVGLVVFSNIYSFIHYYLWCNFQPHYFLINISTWLYNNSHFPQMKYKIFLVPTVYYVWYIYTGLQYVRQVTKSIDGNLTACSIQLQICTIQKQPNCKTMCGPQKGHCEKRCKILNYAIKIFVISLPSWPSWISHLFHNGLLGGYTLFYGWAIFEFDTYYWPTFKILPLSTKSYEISKQVIECVWNISFCKSSHKWCNYRSANLFMAFKKSSHAIMAKTLIVCNMCIIPIHEFKILLSFLYQTNSWRDRTENWNTYTIAELFNCWKEINNVKANFV